MKRIALMVALACTAWQAGATEPIYRCGSSYSQAPCPDGKLIDAADPRSAAQGAEARKAAALERRRIAQLERERKAREAADKASAAKASASNAKAGKAKKKSGKAQRIVPLKTGGPAS